MWTIRLHPSFVHIHDQNRDGYGAAGLDVHSLLGDVLSVGWDWSCPNPIACELSPADVERVERFNLELVKASEGGECALAPVEAGSVAHTKSQKALQGLKVIGKPGKAVEAIALFEIGKLILVPSTSRIHVGAGAAPHGSVGLGIYLRNKEGEPIHMSLAPSTSATCMAAFWFVTSSHDASECNMKMSFDASGNDHSDKALGTMHNIKIPLMVNTDRIEPGTRLVVYREKHAKAFELEELEPEPKRRRATKGS